MKPGKISINRTIREMFHLAGLHISDGNKTFRAIGKFERAVREDERGMMWAELEPFIGLDPRHDGHPPSWQPKCPQCAEVRRIKEKYNAAIREGK